MDNSVRRSGKDVNYRYHDGTKALSGINLSVRRGACLGLLGSNGSGKTTLLNVLLGSMEPHQGSVRRGTGVEVAYFDQHRSQLDDSRSVMDNVADGSGFVTVSGRTRHIVGYLEDFLFPPERARLPVKVLSGGERNRALLARLFTKPSNVLVMDEPTNDLDTDTLELLEEMLMQYQGTVLLVSHDRAFLNNIATSTIVFEGNGCLREYVGGYDDWLRQSRQVAPEVPEKPAKKKRPRPRQERPRSLTFKEREELDALPALIESLEAERGRLFGMLASPEFYQQEAKSISVAKARLDELEEEITGAYARWELLESIPDSRSA